MTESVIKLKKSKDSSQNRHVHPLIMSNKALKDVAERTWEVPEVFFCGLPQVEDHFA